MGLIRLRMLDANFALINSLDYINLQWNRSYYSCGQYSVMIPASQYDAAAKYIYTPDRRETGLIQKVELVQNETGEFLQISGFFLEKWLDDKIILPTMNFYGNLEDGVRQILAGNKEDIPVVLGTPNNPRLGTTVRFQDRGSELADKIYKLLEAQEMSFTLDHDYENTETLFNVWRGKDRTQGQADNNRVTFSRGIGNIDELHKTRDISGFKNYAVIAGEGEGAARVIVEYDASSGAYKQKLWVDARDLSSEELTVAAYKDTLLQRGIEKLEERQIINEIDISIDPLKAGRAYLVDFDLGDKCDVIITAENFHEELTARVVEANEVVKENNWTVDLVIGNKTPTVLQKATR